ncbi:MAG: hypothetical protein JW963_06930, partial [Anaerolineales bacterium]|nr:hypothetical protein [Anaerolineales bacterium]
PTVAGVLALVIRSDRRRRALLIIVSSAHLAVTGLHWMERTPCPDDIWLALDETGLLFLTTASVLFFAASISAIWYLDRESNRAKIKPNNASGHLSESIFTACLFFFLSCMTLVCASRNFGLIWIGVEATTLASAPLVIFHRNSRSLEAMWKYLLICSVGIALALMGNLLLALSTQFAPEGNNISLNFNDLLRHASLLNIPWFKVSFVFLLVGYGTKMGLAPMHTWLPDAHSESPSLVSALLSGALLNCAFLGILRAYAICIATNEAVFAQQLFLILGLISMVVSAAFILGQSDYKRMLAYSSIEHMGLMAIGVGLGGGALFGVFFHSVNHSLAKGALFLAAGNILAARGTKQANSITGLLRTQPVSACFWILGFLAITGTPPFGTFFSEWLILREAFIQGHYWLAGICLVLLAIVFIGMATIMLRMVLGNHKESSDKTFSESPYSVLPIAFLLAFVLLIGVDMPIPLRNLITDTAKVLEGVIP